MKRFLGVLCALLLVFSLVAIALPSPVQAATFTVNSTGDTVDCNPGDGVAETAPGNGICTLRAAIQETNALAGPDTINLPSGNYTLSIAGANEDVAATGDLDITDNLTITGADQVTTIIDGGGIDRVFQVHSGNVDISSITVQSGNVTGDGGGIHNKGTLTLTNCTFLSNSAWDGGGGMYNGESSPTVTNCTFFSNSAGWGGGMYNGESSPTVTKCNFFSNSASNGGGGMYNHDYSSSTVTNCLFHSNNSTMGWGGGMQNHKSSPMITNCTFSNNSGGGMLDWDSSPTVANCIFWNNGYEIDNDATSTPLVTYSDIKGGYSGATNIDDNPLFVDPAADDYHLQSGSPCIDKGTNTGAPTEDIEGNPRPIDGDGIPGAVTDMGAYEYVPPPPTPPPVEVGGTVYPVNKLTVLAPWIILAAVIIPVATIVIRRRRAQSWRQP